MSDYFISDCHFHHQKVILYENRPFKDSDEMNELMIKNWNNTVSKRDKVFFLGDFSFSNKKNTQPIIERLNGWKFFVLGNHDYKWSPKSWREMGVDEATKYPIIYKDFYMLSHFPLYLNDKSPYANLHGHIHSKKMTGGNFFNVSVECINYTPILFEDIQKTFVSEDDEI